MSTQRALVIGAGGGVGRATAGALSAAGARVLAVGRERDATDPAQVAALLGEADPDLVVVAAGTRPRMASIEEQSWESFSTPWNVDAAAAATGESVEAYMRNWPVALDAAGVARAILSIASGEEHREAMLLGLTADGLEEI
jgi:NAD(P)-dependent dehydrogenase (short-subunit alcohol dehydrogenase family)